MLGGCNNNDSDSPIRNRVRSFIHAAEGTFMAHCLAVTYARWFAPPALRSQPEEMRELERGLAANVCRDLGWLDGELQGRRFLAGEALTAADTMVLFSVQFIFARDLCAGRKQSEWGEVDRWIGECEGSISWRKAVEKTGHKL